MCSVLNKYDAGKHGGVIYIGRGSKWGNPVRIGADGDRATVIAKHARWLRISITCCAHSMSFAARICCASARRRRAMAICCCGSPTCRGRSASRGGGGMNAVAHKLALPSFGADGGSYLTLDAPRVPLQAARLRRGRLVSGCGPGLPLPAHGAGSRHRQRSTAPRRTECPISGFAQGD